MLMSGFPSFDDSLHPTTHFIDNQVASNTRRTFKMNLRRAAALAQPGVYKFSDANSVAFLAFPGTRRAPNAPAPNARYLTQSQLVTTTRTVRLRAN